MILAGWILAVLILASLPLCVRKPWIGMLIFVGLCTATPQHLTAGFAYDFPFAKLVALAILLGLPFTKERSPLPRTPEVYLVTGFWILCVLSTFFAAIQPERAMAAIARVSKIFLMAGVTLVLFRDRRKLRLLLIVIAGSIGFYGVKGGILTIATRGREIIWGPPESILADSNTLAFALAMVMPLFVYLRYDEERAWVRHAWLVVFGLSILAVLGTYSRGGMIVLLPILAMLVLLTFKGDRAVTAVALGALALAVFSPPKWQARVSTVVTKMAAQKDSSTNQRANSAYVAARLGLDHPLLGAGFEPFSPEVYGHYIPGYSDYHNAHNHYLQVFAEHGAIALGLFVALLGTVIARLQQTFRAARGDPAQAWVRSNARALQIAMVAYALGGFLLNRPYFEPFYQLVAAAVILSELQRDLARGRTAAITR